jgi:hypothetical protein
VWLIGKSQHKDLVTALARATSHDRDLRYAHMEDFLDVIERHSAGPAPSSAVEIAVGDRVITVTVNGQWTRQTVQDCAERVTAALRPPGPWRIAYRFSSSAGYHQAGVIDGLDALHKKHRPLLERVAFLAADPQTRGLGVVLGCSMQDLPWKTFLSQESMQSWLEGEAA